MCFPKLVIGACLVDPESGLPGCAVNVRQTSCGGRASSTRTSKGLKIMAQTETATRGARIDAQ